ncbi:MAG: hypothetical protein HYU78_06900 [Rhodocyclales bacterium]|nr:hypothetical protein [Rhodocyclales bacterium]
MSLREENTCSAVGLRSRFWLQMKRTYFIGLGERTQIWKRSNEAVEKLGKELETGKWRGRQTIPEAAIVRYRAIVKVVSPSWLCQIFRKEFFYSFNVEVTGTARLYRAASGGPQGYVSLSPERHCLCFKTCS